MYSKKVSEGFIVTVGNTNLWNPISYDEYSAIIRAIENRPKPPTGYDYKLNDASLEWELVKLPPIEPEPEYEPTAEDKAEAYDILMGGDSE